MNSVNRLSRENPIRLASPSGLHLEMNRNGSIRRMDCGEILLNLFLGTEIEGGPANLFLRRYGSSLETAPLLGPRSPAAFQPILQGAAASGEWGPFRYTLSLVLAQSAPAWFWHLRIENGGTEPESLDFIYAQDLGLAHYGAVRLNEYYVSHYVDHTPLSHSERGVVMASRQNQSMGGKNPWTLIGSLFRGVSFATDALQVYGLATRAGRAPAGVVQGLPGSRLQHEHSMAAIQDDPVRLEPGETSERGFFGWFEADHLEASSSSDLAFVGKALSLPEASPIGAQAPATAGKPSATLFSSAPVLDALDLSEGEIAGLFGSDLREAERVDGRLLSFFAPPQRHIVLKQKELQVLRPHANMLRTGNLWVPDESAMTSTTWMSGVFHSLVTQGHVSINRFLSTVHGYLGFFSGNGQRLFMDLGTGWQLLGVPSAFEMTPRSSRWVYKHPGGTIVVRSEGLTDRHELTLTVEVLSGPPASLLLSNHVAVNGDDGSSEGSVQVAREGDGVFVRPAPDSDVGRRFPEGGFRISPDPGTIVERIGGDELLFFDGRSRNQPFLCIVTGPSRSAGFRLWGDLVSDIAAKAKGDDPHLREKDPVLRVLPPRSSPAAAAAARLGEILPWFVQNGLIHYLTPRGVEQFSGGGWGTRDICQGPVEMLLGMGRFAPIRDLLIRVFKNQNADGDWPQWFMFFDRERNIRPGDSHGDIVYWPLLALARYLIATEDKAILDERVPFFHPDGDQNAEWASIGHHVERARKLIGKRIIPGTLLAAYGNGDWNDSLQPVQPAMRERLCSAWTVTLHYRTLTALGTAFQRIGRREAAAALEHAAAIREDFRRILLVDGVLTGFAYFFEDGRIDYLLHPRDRSTGLSYSLLAMIHAVIDDLLTPQEADRHFRIIREHLLGPDGARLFDRPLQYRGGHQRFFQRAESAAYFGREIGLMYTHAHLRYAEALAHYGDAEGFFQALCRANPIGIREIVPAATLRQSNCYYSSSDAAFADRYQASAEYDRIAKNEIPLEGGWRVYSSGAGIWARLLFQCFLGVRQLSSRLVLDPVIPRTLDGLRVEVEIAGRPVELLYRVRQKGCGPASTEVNGRKLSFTRETNPYRTGGIEIPMEEVLERFEDSDNRMTVYLD